jgi:phage tail sheath protein FI
MPEYLSPGVYVEEVDTGPRPIQWVGTSTVGRVLRHLPKLATGIAIGIVVGLILKRAL